ncbi:unnamed protein product [Candidula unifasciata]|uniref:PNK FHA domain-containing protein n=1 Tax=Candidula unifasciata TaxID=100452 RepID=A0A8S3YLC2_9EUPU|nr:unnamed protein product [Candidula unifasciata]
MNNITSCQLVCLQKTHDAIDLPHGATVVIGRSPQTKITDPRCSRTQLEITADWQHQNVSVKQKGLNPTAVDGKDIGSDSVVTMGVDSTLFILSGLFPHKVVFKGNQDSTVEKQSDSRHTNSSNTDNDQKIENRKKETQNVNSPGSMINSGKKERTEKEFTRKDAHSTPTTNSKTHTQSSTKQHKTILASKRHSDDSDAKQPVEKKMKIESKTNGNGEHKSGSSSKHSGSRVHASATTKEASRADLVKPKHIDSSSRDSHDSNDSMDHDGDKHLADVNEKLKKMKQDAANNTKTNPKKTEKVLTPGSSTSSSPSSSHGLKKPSESSKSGGKAPSVPSDKPIWENNVDHFVFTSKGVVPRSKIAGFDLDGTIIATKSGKTFPQDADDWKIYVPEVFNKLKDLQKKKYKVVFFTNQLGVARRKTKIEDLMKKIENVVAKLQVPVQVFIATHEGRYRKPMTGMWEQLENQYNGRVSIDLASSFYVGDAAGRLDKWAPKKKKDFSCSDRLFALNIGIAFKTPEEFFQDQKPTSLFKMPDFDPRKLNSDAKLLNGDSKLTSDSKETIILVGFPASGKSHFATNVMASKGYKVVNRDSLGSWKKCVKHAQEALVNSSVVIDNTNLTKDERSRYVMCAKKAGVPCRCFVFTTTVEHCRHNERFRQMITKSHEKINEMIFNQIKKKYEEPSMTEGFTEIVNVNFVPRFSSREEEATYRKFLLEK